MLSGLSSSINNFGKIINMERVYAKEVFEKKEGEVLLKGWVERKRELGKVAFIILRDRSGKVQCVAKEREEVIKKIKELDREDVVEVRGRIVENEKAPGGKEVIIEEIKRISKAFPLPIEIDEHIKTDLSKRLDYRFLDLRREKVRDIFWLKAKVLKFFREFLTEKGYIEVNTPKIVAEGTEGGAEIFPVLYYDKQGFLAQSPQFYKQMMQAAGFEKVFEIGYAYRAEKSHTVRHVSEILMLDVEESFISFEKHLGLLEDMIRFVIKRVLEEGKEEIERLGVKVEVPEKPFPRLHIKEIVKILGLEKADDLGTEGEKRLGEYVKEKEGHDFVFVIGYPFEVRPFYTMKDEQDEFFTKSFDLLFKGTEIVTGGQREHRYDVLVRQASEKGIKIENARFYFEAFKYGIPPHAGFGLGIDRFLMELLNLKNIREVILFPRDAERLTP